MGHSYHFALAALVLGILALGVAFGLGFYAPGWFATPTQETEAVLGLGVIAAIGLLFGAIAVEGKDGRSSKGAVQFPPRLGLRPRGTFRRDSRGIGSWKGRHVAWLVVSLIFLVLVAAGAYAWAFVYEGAGLVSAGVISFLVFLLSGLLVAIIFVAMKTRSWVAGRHRRG